MKIPTMRMNAIRIVHYRNGNLVMRYAGTLNGDLITLPTTWSMVPSFCQFGPELEFTITIGN